MPGQATLEQVADATIGEIAPLVTNGTQPKLEYVSLKSGRSALIRSEITIPNPSVPVLVSLDLPEYQGIEACYSEFHSPTYRRDPYPNHRGAGNGRVPLRRLNACVDVRFGCRNPECREPITRRNQIWCSYACRQMLRRRAMR